jgi:hypothetical protein
MRCPTCKTTFHSQPDEIKSYWINYQSGDVMQILVQLCPECRSPIIIQRFGKALEKPNMAKLHSVHDEIVFPVAKSIDIPSEVPENYRDDLYEAHQVLETSPKSSAALCRRILQKIFHDIFNIKRRDLSQEIDEFINNAKAPTYLVEAIDAIRQIGNFAAHPIKNTNTGAISDVELGEAEWLLEVIEALFDFTFVQPEKLKQRKEALNKKLNDHGKPNLKGSV